MGSIRTDCTPEERSVFTDLLALANESRTRGVIQANSSTPYSHDRLAEIINVTPELLERSLKKFEVQKRIRENAQGIHVLSFDFYNPPIQHTGKRGRPPKQPQEQLSLEDQIEPWTEEHDPKAAELWGNCLVNLKKEVSTANYRTWMTPTKGLSYNGSKFVLGAPNNFIGDYLLKNQMSLIENAISAITKKRVEVEIRLFEAGPGHD